MTLFVDTSVWYAAADRGDRSHSAARRVLGVDEARVTTDHVLVEVWLLMRHRAGWSLAERIVSSIRAGIARVETVSEADVERALAIGRDFADQRFALTDRTSFAVMERLGLRRAASFDADFAIYRFGRGRTGAFEVVR